LTVEEATVMGSSSDLALAIRNLCDNAIRYTNEGGTVDLRVASVDGRVTVSIRDTGVGIPTRSLERVFERFYRVDEARSRATGGTGLGLSIVRHVIDRHGGEIQVRSQLGVGSTFTIDLPAAEPEV
jgi:two-component system sensor histidine kinase SenX3